MPIRRNQRHQRLWVMIILASFLPILDAFYKITSDSFGGTIFDPEHFHLGRMIGAMHFSAVYTCVIARILIGTRSKLGKIILPTLALLFCLAFAAFIFFLLFKDKDHIEILTFSINGLALRQLSQGIFAMMPTIGFVMIMTPILIPSVYISRIGDLFSRDIQTGTKYIDEYLKFSHRQHKKRKPKFSFPSQNHLSAKQLPDFPDPLPNIQDSEEDDQPDVLLVEDDLTCATLVLKFCSKLKLDCIHVESLDVAQQKFEQYQHSLRLLILDNFVRVGETQPESQIKTGAQWAEKLNTNFPKESRRFHIALMSGHTHLFADLANHADLVLQKPWNPQELFRYLKDQKIV